jgi:hypothetical protein
MDSLLSDRKSLYCLDLVLKSTGEKRPCISALALAAEEIEQPFCGRM